MKCRAVNAVFALLILIILPLQPNSGRILAQENPSTSGPGFFTVLPYYHSRNYQRTGCHPVEVRAVSIGAQPPEVLTSQVVIESFSDKPVAAVKLRWNVYSRDVGRKKARSSCDATPEAADIYLSGTTPLIQVGHFAKGEVYNITSNPRATFPLATKTIVVDRPIIAWDEVMGLTLDGTRATFKGAYTAIIYASEVQFEDGTRWEGEVK
jgi:hypothetical protein